MPSSYTSNLAIEKPANGEQVGTWGATVNDNMDIVDRLTSQVGSIALTGTTYTLTTSTSGALSEGHYTLIKFTGTPSGTCTVTISPNNIQRIYTIYNTTNQTVTMSQGSGSTVSVPAGEVAQLYADGAGSGASVVQLTDKLKDVLYSGDIGSTVQGYDADLAAIGALAKTDGNFIVGNGSTWVAESGNTALASLGVTATATELNKLDGVTATTAEINKLDGVTASTAELNILDGLTATTSNLNTASTHYVPSGGIILWSGSAGSIPSGWFLCDGSNGTPDLRNRFVVGAGSSYAVGATGGADSVTLSTSQIPSHSHSFSATTGGSGSHSHGFSATTGGSGSHSHGFSATTGGSGSHSHTYSGTTSGTSVDHTHNFSGTTSHVGDHTHSIPDGSGVDGAQALEAAFVTGTIQSGAAGAHSHTFSGTTSYVSADHSHTFSGTTSGVGNHTHSVSGTTAGIGDHTHSVSGTTAGVGDHTHSVSGTTGTTGSGASHENRPPYYALAYIMKA
jgi:microcystin-dependent protein